jgi:uncharacterized membrane protein
MREHDTLYVLAAAYDDVDDAVADYEAVKALYYEVKTSHDFDATVVAKDHTGTVTIVKKHEEPTRHGAAVGLGWGLAAGVVAALFPPVGILGALAVGGGGGAAIGAITGHASGGMDRADLKQLGEVLDEGTAGLLVVYEADLDEQIKSNVAAARRMIDTATTVDTEALATDLKKADLPA